MKKLLSSIFCATSILCMQNSPQPQDQLTLEIKDPSISTIIIRPFSDAEEQKFINPFGKEILITILLKLLFLEIKIAANQSIAIRGNKSARLLRMAYYYQ